jgi:peptidoglycan/LPS O-acetylase OafA/YrhL
MSMLNLRQLPLFLRVVGILGLLFPLASLVILLAMVVLFITGGDVSRQRLANDPRLIVSVVNLNMLGLACGFAVNRYRTRFRQPNRRPFPLDSWQSQARTIALLAALPLCAIALAAVISPTQEAAILMLFAISALGVFALLRAYGRLVTLPRASRFDRLG